jgi:hypothetical protein
LKSERCGALLKDVPVDSAGSKLFEPSDSPALGIGTRFAIHHRLEKLFGGGAASSSGGKSTAQV